MEHDESGLRTSRWNRASDKRGESVTQKKYWRQGRVRCRTPAGGMPRNSCRTAQLVHQSIARVSRSRAAGAGRTAGAAAAAGDSSCDSEGGNVADGRDQEACCTRSARKRRKKKWKKSDRGKGKQNELLQSKVWPMQGAIWPTCRHGKRKKKNERGWTPDDAKPRSAHCVELAVRSCLSDGIVFCQRVGVNWTRAKRHCPRRSVDVTHQHFTWT